MDYDIDASATTSLVSVTNRVNSKSDRCLPSQGYSFLTPEERDLLRKIPPNVKSAILKGRNSKNRNNNRFDSTKSNNPSYKIIKLPDKPPRSQHNNRLLISLL